MTPRRPGPQPRRPPRDFARPLPFPVAVAFFLSGASALVYELVWFRLLGDVFGSTAAAAATVLAAYLFGLGLGAWAIGHRADRIGSRIVAWYVAVEVAIAAYGLASRWLFDGGAALYAAGYRAAGGVGGSLLATRVAISFLLVALPTVLMGGTFPLMVRIVAERGHGTGVAAGRAYAINTAGAALGALALPMILLPAAGFTRSLLVAALGNIAAAALVYRWSRARNGAAVTADAGAGADARTDAGPDAGPAAGADSGVGARAATGPGADAGSDAAAERPGVRATPGARPIPLVVAFLFSSFAALALQTVWARHLGIQFGSEIHTFAFLLAVYLAGLVAGGALAARLVARGTAPERVFCGGLLLAALAVAATLPFLDRLIAPQLAATLALGGSYRAFLATVTLAVLVVVFPAALGFGLALPAVVERLARFGRATGTSVGEAYAVNTLGTTAGALCAGFVLVPVIGTQRTLELCVALLALAYALSTRGPRRLLLAPVVLIVALLPRWEWELAHAGYAKDPLLAFERYASGGTAALTRENRIVWLREGTTATVGVLQGPAGDVSLLVDGKADASTQPLDMVTQRLLAVVPALFHETPRRALVIGLGSGVTAAALLRFPLERLDVVEISPEVVDAARAHFGAVTDGILDPATQRDGGALRLHVDDGRTFLEFSPPASYDIIVNEPSNPWVTGVSTLFTDEFFAAAKERLRPGGVLGQWFHYYSMSQDNLRVILRTFARHFPASAVLVLRGGGRWTGDLLLLGVNGPLALRYEPDDPSLPEGVRAMLAQTGNTTLTQLMAGLALTPDTLPGFAGEGPLNTDDLPLLELRAPADRFERGTENFAARMFGPNPRLFLPVRRAARVTSASPARAVLAADGLEAAPAVDAARPLQEGLLALTRTDDAGRPHRFLMTGREFEGLAGLAAVWHIDAAGGAAPSPEKLAETAAALVPGGVVSRGRVTVGGHEAEWCAGGAGSAAGAGSHGRLALGWYCPLRGRAYFAVRDGSGGADAARELAGLVACAHDDAGTAR